MYRLNLPELQLTGPVKPTDNYFNGQFLNGNSQPNESWLKTSIRTSLSNVVASVHQKLKHNRVQKKLGPTIPDAIKEIRTDSLPAANHQAKLAELTEGYTLGSNKSQFKQHPNGPVNRTKSIPKAKASLEQKSHQRMRRSIGLPNDSKNFTTRKRIEEIRHQKRVLQEMLSSHLKLKRDRQSIAMEIEMMRRHLDEITNKVDNSLKKLHNNQPVVQAPRQQKVIRPKSNQRRMSLDSRLTNVNTMRK